MEEIFPTVAKDPNYGIRARPPKLIALSASEWRVFNRDYMEGKNEDSKVLGVSRCENAVVTPWWNFVEVRAKVIARNARPTNYTISLNIKSQGKVVALFNTTEKLTIDNTYEFISYIPLRWDEMDYFDSAELTYEKLPN